MKKLGLLALVATVSLVSAGTLNAADKKSAAGGLELSGNVTVVTGWQNDNKYVSGPGTTISGVNDIDTAGAGLGQLGDFRGNAAPSKDTFNFYLDQVELDINKTFGENIRIRADLDFGRALSGSGLTTTADTNFNLEQGYVTANIPVGNGLEFLIGRFNTPIGLESVDRAENIALSYTNIYRYVRPHNTTGAKLYYAFNDLFDWHIYVVNNLQDTINIGGFGVASPLSTVGLVDTPVPSYGTRFGFTWGQKGKEHVIGLSYAGGPEAAVRGANLMRHFTHIADLDFSLHATENFVIAGEAIYRQDNRNGACPSVAGNPATFIGNSTKNCKAWGGQLTLAYNANETWGVYGRFDYLHDFQGNYTQVDQQIMDAAIGASYQITDGAKLKMEYRIDFEKNANINTSATTAVGYHGSMNNAFALEFAYNF